MSKSAKVVLEAGDGPKVVDGENCSVGKQNRDGEPTKLHAS